MPVPTWTDTGEGLTPTLLRGGFLTTHLCFPSAIRISRKGRHTLLNFCLHAALTFTVFAGGINRTKYPILCQAVSLPSPASSLRLLTSPARGGVCDHCLVYEVIFEYLFGCFS